MYREHFPKMSDITGVHQNKTLEVEGGVRWSGRSDPRKQVDWARVDVEVKQSQSSIAEAE